jgi:hypothetical protein
MGSNNYLSGPYDFSFCLRSLKNILENDAVTRNPYSGKAIKEIESNLDEILKLK